MHMKVADRTGEDCRPVVAKYSSGLISAYQPRAITVFNVFPLKKKSTRRLCLVVDLPEFRLRSAVLRMTSIPARKGVEKAAKGHRKGKNVQHQQKTEVYRTTFMLLLTTRSSPPCRHRESFHLFPINRESI
eukprot:scaffold1565_cov144-Skeletonema_dohrnii-CCMP3373.AAC.7